MKDMTSEFKPSTIAMLIAAGKADYIQGKPRKKTRKTRTGKTGYIARGSETRQKGSSIVPINRPASMWDSISMLDD